MKPLKITALLGAIALLSSHAWAFCGFYVAKADMTLFNTTSQVIIARDGDRSIVTMSSDFQGAVEDFAMVVPVPEVLKRQNIRIAKSEVFEKLDTYTAPRVVEYTDNDPCRRFYAQYLSSSMAIQEVAVMDFAQSSPQEDFGVKIEAKYSVEEYDILILSAKESGGLKTWLNLNGYKIPENAEEVLDPYIKDEMKFFVVKVDLEKFKATGEEKLRPLQIAYKSDNFMLPIRLGMANANGNQDMVVYLFTKNGRVETTNYRTAKLPTDRDVPEFVQDQFGQFYVSVYDKFWAEQGRQSVVLEYAWDVSGNQPVKCDPCPTPAMVYSEMREAGVSWLLESGQNYLGPCFITRLHVRYNRADYPQDLVFQETPNKERFQGRYVVRHPPISEFKCKDAQPYLQGLVKRRHAELDELASLTGWDISQYDEYISEYASMIEGGEWIDNDFDNEDKNELIPGFGGGPGKPGKGWMLLLLVAFFVPTLVDRMLRQWQQQPRLA